jgi:hypothetical protein
MSGRTRPETARKLPVHSQQPSSRLTTRGRTLSHEKHCAPSRSLRSLRSARVIRSRCRFWRARQSARFRSASAPRSARLCFRCLSASAARRARSSSSAVRTLGGRPRFFFATFFFAAFFFFTAMARHNTAHAAKTATSGPRALRPWRRHPQAAHRARAHAVRACGPGWRLPQQRRRVGAGPRRARHRPHAAHLRGVRSAHQRVSVPARHVEDGSAP